MLGSLIAGSGMWLLDDSYGGMREVVILLFLLYITYSKQFS